MKMTYKEFLKEDFDCYIDCNGKWPCDKGAACDACECWDIPALYDDYCREYDEGHSDKHKK